MAGAEGREADWGRPRPDSGQPPFHSSRGCFSEMEILSSRILHFSREPGTLGFYVNHQILKSWQRNQMFKTVCMQVKKKIDLLIPKVTPGLKLYDPYLFMTEERSACKPEKRLAAPDRSRGPDAALTLSPEHQRSCVPSPTNWEEIPAPCEDSVGSLLQRGTLREGRVPCPGYSHHVKILLTTGDPEAQNLELSCLTSPRLLSRSKCLRRYGNQMRSKHRLTFFSPPSVLL